MIVRGNIVDIEKRSVFKGEITINNGKIVSIVQKDCEEDHYILPGFVDAHIHIESSMLVPSEFARIAVKHGTVATVSDPHEIANVLGIEGVNFMIDNGKSGGLNNEGMQILVTNRAVEFGQKVYTEVLFPRMLKEMNVYDWKLTLYPNEEEDEASKLQS